MIFYARLQLHQTKAEKWWFHLYSLLKYSKLDKKNDTAERTPEVEEEEEGKDQILETLNGFILSSTYGEFTTRIQLLHTFYQQLLCEINTGFKRDPANEPSIDMQQHLRNLTYNLRLYYSQFAPKVEENMKQLREPLEKKVRDFIQLAKWDDLNYYALKTSSEKSHRTLNKLSRHLEELLRQPVATILEKPEDGEVTTVGRTEHHFSHLSHSFRSEADAHVRRFDLGAFFANHKSAFLRDAFSRGI